MPAWFIWGAILTVGGAGLSWLSTRGMTDELRRQNDIVDRYPPVVPTQETIRSAMYLAIVGMILVALAYVVLQRNRSKPSTSTALRGGS